MKNKINIITEKSINIFTLIMLILSMLIFEFGYCNTAWIKCICEGGMDSNYHFSFCRMIIYIVLITLYIVFKKGFIKEALQASENRYKRIFIYITIIVTILCAIITLIICKMNSHLIRAMSIGLITAFLGSLFIIYVSRDLVRNVIVLAGTLGIVFTFTTNYNHAIDEKRHFMTALNLSFLNFDYVKSPITDKQIEKLPQLSKYTAIDDFFERYNPEVSDEVKVEDTPSTPADYNFICYLFPAIGITIARVLGGSIIDLYIMGRIMNLILYVVLICMAIKIVPYKKNIFFVVAMIPYILLLASSYSIDGFCIGTTFIFIAYCLKLYKEKEIISLKKVFILVALFILLLLGKNMAYICVGAMIFILPLAKLIKNNKKCIPIIVGISVLAIALGIMTMLYIKNSNIIGDDRASGEVNVSKQLNLIITNPVHDLKLVREHFKDTLLNFNWYCNLHPGAFFTSSANSLMLPLLIFILYISLTESDYIFKIKDKVIMITTFLLVWGMTSAVLYLTFTQIGALHIDGYQTRYIIPVLPLLLFCISNNKVVSKQSINRSMNISIISALFILVGIAQLIVV